ncbi:MAG: YrdB family protein [Actinomycetia bacterium]|nr:YrdB family protein [Actinomycetes bacterium]MCH9800079.1 YrdB family protein [Actinomycetes bacterium]
MNPPNLLLRLLLEIAALVLLGLWGWQTAGWLLGFGLPILAATAWGVFNVPGDPSRSGKAPIVVPGWVRLVIELAIFATAALAAWSILGLFPTIFFVLVVVAHYLLSLGRIRWLLSATV